MEYLVTAFDDTDENALQRRMAARAAHLESADQLKAAGKIIAGGAILDDDNKMIGSTLYVNFATREELNQWLQNDPYVIQGVWKDVNVLPIKLAVKP
ncbi:MAG: hypothetical protein ACI95C_002657 [Pseudohongiellaceae bacterium]|jgi:uncharacterized protein YciI